MSDVPKEWLIEISNTILKDWDSSFCKKCGKDLDGYFSYCKDCNRDKKIDDIISEKDS